MPPKKPTQQQQHHEPIPEDHDEELYEDSPAPPANRNPGLIAGLTTEQSTSVQQFVSASITASNNDMLERIFQRLDARIDERFERLEARFSLNNQQIAAPHNPRIIRTPSVTPQPPTIHNSPPQTSPAANNNSLPYQPNLRQNHSETTRWRGEELGTFNPEKDDVYTFTNRCYQVSELRGHRLVQLNLDLQLRGLAIDWYNIELSPNDKAILASAPDVST